MKLRLSIFAAALWWASLTTVAGMVVPMLFTQLGNPAMAGMMAAKIFTAQTWLSTACAMLLLLILNNKELAALRVFVQRVMKFTVAGLLLALLVEFGVSPRIVSARVNGDLKFWHALGSALYLLQWICAALSLWGLLSPSDSAKVLDAVQDNASANSR